MGFSDRTHWQKGMLTDGCTVEVREKLRESPRGRRRGDYRGGKTQSEAALGGKRGEPVERDGAEGWEHEKKGS